MFVPEIPLETEAELNCNSVTFLNICPKSTMSKCDTQRVMDHKINDLVKCEVNINIYFYYVFTDLINF